MRRHVKLQVQQGLSKLHALVHLREGATENRDETRLPSRIRQREPNSNSQNVYASKSKNWMLGFGTRARVTRSTCEESFGMSPAPLTALSSTYLLWQNVVDDLLHLSSTSYSRIPSRPVCAVLA